MNNNFSKKMKKIMARPDFGIVLIALVLFLGFSVLTDAFFTSFNLYNLFRTTSQYIFIGLSIAFVVVLGGTNLAVGAIGGFSGVILGELLQNANWPILPACIVTLLVGALVGAIIGTLISKLNLLPFVVTLAFQFIFFGLETGIAKGFPYIDIPSEITTLGRGKIFPWLPTLLVVAVGVLLVVGYIFKFTVFGRQILATGGNKEAARLSGVNTDRITIMGNMLSGLFAAAAALIFTTRLGSIQATLGSDWMLIAFAVSILGGTSPSGGEYTSLGVFAAAMTMVLIKNGLTMANVDMYFEQAIQGVIILGAVVIDALRAKSNQRSILNDIKKRTQESASA